MAEKAGETQKSEALAAPRNKNPGLFTMPNLTMRRRYENGGGELPGGDHPTSSVWDWPPGQGEAVSLGRWTCASARSAVSSWPWKAEVGRLRTRSRDKTRAAYPSAADIDQNLAAMHAGLQLPGSLVTH